LPWATEAATIGCIESSARVDVVGTIRIAVLVSFAVFATRASAEQCLPEQETACKDALDKCTSTAVREAALLVCLAARKQCGEAARAKCAGDPKASKTPPRLSIDWRTHVLLRPGKDGALAVPDAVTEPPLWGRHYVSMSFDSLYLHQADRIYSNQPDQLLLAGKQVLVMTPPDAAPEAMRKKVSSRALASSLKLRGDRVFWKDGDTEYTDTPVLVFTVERHDRWPNPDTDLRKLVRSVDSLYESGAYERALALLEKVLPAIYKDRIITHDERELERGMTAMRRARIQAALAKQGNDAAAHLKALQTQLTMLEYVKKESAKILLPDETKSLELDIEKVRRAITEAGGAP
jgi:hypothetical protein